MAYPTSYIAAFSTLQNFLRQEIADGRSAELSTLAQEVDGHGYNLRHIEDQCMDSPGAYPHAEIIRGLDGLSGYPASRTLSPALLTFLQSLPAQVNEQLRQLTEQLSGTSEKKQRQELHQRRAFLQVLQQDLTFTRSYSANMQAIAEVAQQEGPLKQVFQLLFFSPTPA